MCDDIELHHSGEAIAYANACEQGTTFIRHALNSQDRCWQKGQLISQEQLVDRTVQLLRNAQSPGILGLSLVTVEDIAASVRLAELLNAWLCTWPADPIRFWGHDAPDLALSRAETEQAANLILFIGFEKGVDAVQPRFRERHFSKGPGKNRTQLEVLWTPQERMKNILHLRLHDEKGELLPAHLKSLSAAATKAQCIQIYFLAQLALDDVPYVAQWQQWAAHQRAHRRVGISLLGSTGKARTVTEALTWLTGFPGPLRFSNNQAQYLPHMGEAEKLILQHALDVILWIGVDPNLFWKSMKQKHPHFDRSRFKEIVISQSPDFQQAEFAMEVPLLSPVYDAHIVRGDGVMLRLVGQAKGQPSPTAALLETISRKVQL
ncbi:MAG: hypothetical protein JNJ77_12660 [Planctomycetia bacterium]|nr:hypothetical protein [Planctomycetia bacterium]